MRETIFVTRSCDKSYRYRCQSFAFVGPSQSSIDFPQVLKGCAAKYAQLLVERNFILVNYGGLAIASLGNISFVC